MQLNILRDDWILQRLGDFAISVKGKKPKNQSEVQTEVYKYPYVDIQGFEKNIFDSYTDGQNCAFCTEDDFLMVWDGSRSGLVGKAVNGAIGSTLVKINLPKIENRFAYYFLKSKYIELNTNAKGTGTPHVNPDLLWNYSFPIVPLLEQKAIIAKIEQLFSELDKGIESLKTAQAKLKIYRQAVLKKAFEGELTKEWREQQTNLPTAEELLEAIKKEREAHYQQQFEEWKHGERSSRPKKRNEVEIIMCWNVPNKWLSITLDGITTLIGDGLHGTPEYTIDTNWYFINGNNLNNGKILIKEDTKSISYQEYLKYKKELNSKTILVSINGTIGNVAFYNGEKVILGKSACYFNLLDSINKNYIFWRINSKQFINYATKNATGSTIKNVPLSAIRSFDIPLCSLEEQTQIVQEIESRLSVCDKIEETIQNSLTKAEALRQSILKKAFEGKLLDAKELEAIKNHPEYESAEKLLQRIKLERAKK